MSSEERALFLNIMIKTMRLDRGLTQEQLAQKIGCSQREVWRYEKPGYKVSPKTLIKISDALNCSMDVLFGKSQHRATPKAIEEFENLKVSQTWI